jgi:hypothetical protein
MGLGWCFHWFWWGGIVGQDHEIDHDVDTQASREASAEQQGDKPEGRHLKRFLIFLLLAVGITVIGFQFRALSTPAAENPTLRDRYSQLVGVYTTDPYAKVQVTAEITWKATSASETLLIALSGPGLKPTTGVVITSSLPQGQEIAGHPYRTTIFRNRYHPESMDGPLAYTSTFTLQQLAALREPLNPGSVVGIFNLPRVTQITKGTFFAHLPVLGYNESLPLPNPYLMSEKGTPINSSMDDFVLLPQEKRPDYSTINEDASAYIDYPGSYDHVLYWEPGTLSATEILYDVKNQISGDQVESDSPVDGHLQDYNYIWTSAGSLEPILTATNISSLGAQDRWNFYSGVVFGIAAAAGIAVVQELPRDIPLARLPRRLTRKRRPASPPPQG